MAVDNFEDHCWKDVVTPEILKTYTPYHRETYIGQRPALLAMTLMPWPPSNSPML